MSARTAPAPRIGPRLRLLAGHRPRRRPIGAWLVFTLAAVLAFFLIIWSRIALDRTAFELVELEGEIAAAQARYEELRLEVARLQAPSRIAPLAEEMGLVFPEETRTVTGRPLRRLDDQRDRWAEMKPILSASNP